MSLENMEPGPDAQAGALPPGIPWNPKDGELVEGEIDIGAFAERGHEVPHAHSYVVRIDCETVRVTTAHPTGESLLAKVGKRPCAFELSKNSCIVTTTSSSLARPWTCASAG